MTFDTARETSEAVNFILRKFSELALNDPLQAQSLDHDHPKESMPTVLVAPTNARDEIKNMADLVCDGTDDHDELDAAQDLLPAPGGRVVAAAGDFLIDTNQLHLGRNSNQHVHLMGMGRATQIKTNDSIGSIIAMGPDCWVSDLELQGASTEIGIGGTSGGTPAGIGTGGNRCRVERVIFQGCDRCIQVSGDQWWIESNDSIGNSGIYFIQDDKNTLYTVIIGNKGAGQIDVGEAENMLIVGNQRHAGIIGTNPRLLTIAGNNFEDAPDNFSDGIIEITADPVGGTFTEPIDITIIGNEMGSMGGSWAVILDGLKGGVISGNHFGGMEEGVTLRNCEDIAVVANLLDTGEIGVRLTDTIDSLVAANLIPDMGEDGIRVEGLSHRNYIHGNKIRAGAAPGDTRFGINIADSAAEDNIVVGNALGAAVDYVGDALKDVGTRTVLTYPNLPIYGDNFVIGGMTLYATPEGHAIPSGFATAVVAPVVLGAGAGHAAPSALITAVVV